MNVVFMGTPDFAAAVLERLYDKGYNVLGVFTQPDKPKGRGYKLTPPPVKVLAQKHNTPVFQPQSLKKNAEDYYKILDDMKPDCVVVAAYGKILPRRILDCARLGCVNVHASLLPKYRGAAPIQRAVLDDEKVTGITTMLMADGIDTGDILLQKSTEIGENETASELFDRLAVMGAELLTQTLEKLDRNEITPIKQDENMATHAAMLSKEMCTLDFGETVRKVHKKICGLSDWPCAVTTLEGKRLKVYKSEIVSDKPCGKPVGTVVDTKNFCVACTDGVVKFDEIQAEGSKRMKTADYLRGKPLNENTVLG